MASHVAPTAHTSTVPLTHQPRPTGSPKNETNGKKPPRASTVAVVATATPPSSDVGMARPAPRKNLCWHRPKKTTQTTPSHLAHRAPAPHARYRPLPPHRYRQSHPLLHCSPADSTLAPAHAPIPPSPTCTIMERVNPPTPTPPQDEPVPVVTGRKAAHSLRLFRGDGEADDDFAAAVPEPGRTSPSHPLLEPVSSATYFPHTPIKETPADSLQHLTADVEFDHGSHGDITKIHKHAQPQPQTRTQAQTQTEPRHSTHTGPDERPPGSSYPLSVELRPFKNKVGGHTAIFRFSRRAVCKALMNRENLWYEAIERRHLGLLKFMPKYIGVLNVRYSSIVEEDATDDQDDDDPDLEPTSPNASPLLPPNSPHTQPPSRAAQPRRPSFPDYKSRSRIAVPTPEVSLDDNRHIIPDRLWQRYSNSAPDVSGFDGLLLSPHDSAPDYGATSVNTDLQAQVILEVFTPQQWRPEGDDIFDMDDDNGSDRRRAVVPRKHTRFERYILLEDLTANLHKPCALDLKMGTRQYGVDATDKKQASQREKCRSTTSRELGVRMCGLQVWDLPRHRYFMRDKYFGRELRSGKPFAKILAKFLYDGVSQYSVASRLPHIIEQLQELFVNFESLHGYRMYGSSILLTYDGAPTDTSGPGPVKVHIIDFAQSVIATDAHSAEFNKPPKHPHLPDMGYLRGLRSLIRYFKALFEIITGSAYDHVADKTTFLQQNRARLDTPCYWIGTYPETDDNAAPGPDPFERNYGSDIDETGISD